MKLTKYEPFRELRGLHDEMNQLFSGFGKGFDANEFARGAWAPSVDIFEDQEKLIVEAELPGMNREDFELSVENNVLTLKGERKFEKKDERDNYHRVERQYGSFVRKLRPFLETLDVPPPSRATLEIALGFILQAPRGRLRAEKWIEEPDLLRKSAGEYTSVAHFSASLSTLGRSRSNSADSFL